MHLPPGQVFDGKLEIVRLLGEGAMGAVYEARHVWLDRTVALKVMTPSELSSLKRFRREVALLSKVQHENVVEIHDAGVCDSRPYMVMELLPGCSLETLLERQGPQLDITRALWITLCIAEALTTMHAKEVVHRDLKPPNIQILDPDAAEPRVKVLDFGISTTLKPSTKLTGTDRALGTPQYMSPEQALAQRVDSRSDAYALGCLLYEMLAGRAPFDDARPMVVATQHVHAPAPDVRRLRPDTPAAVAAIIARCLQKTPDARYRATAELRDACLAAYAAERDDEPQPTLVLGDHAQPTRPMSAPDLTVPTLTASLDALAPLAPDAPTAACKAPSIPPPRSPHVTLVDPTPPPVAPRPTPPPAPPRAVRRASDETTDLRGLEFPDAPAPITITPPRRPLRWLLLIALIGGAAAVAWFALRDDPTSRVVVPHERASPGTTARPKQARRRLSQAQVAAVARQNAASTRACAAPRVEVLVIIDPDGTVRSAQVDAPDGALEPAVHDCLVAAIDRWTFPPFSGPRMAVKLQM